MKPCYVVNSMSCNYDSENNTEVVDLSFFMGRAVTDHSKRIRFLLNEKNIDQLATQSEKQLVKRKCKYINLSLFYSVPCVYVSTLFEFQSESYDEYVDELFALLEFGSVADFILNKNKFKDKDFRNMLGETFLHIAARRAEWLIIKYFLEEGKLSLGDEDEYSETPVFHVVRQDRLDLLFLMMHSGLDIHFSNSSNVSLLHVAAESGAFRIMIYFLRKGVDVNRVNSQGYTALHNALAQDDLVIIEALIDSLNVDLMLLDSDGNSYLHHSVWNNSIEAAFRLSNLRPMLIRHTNHDGVTPFEMACNLNNDYMVMLLQSDVPPLQHFCAMLVRKLVRCNPKLAHKIPRSVKRHLLPSQYQADTPSDQFSIWQT